MRFHVFFFPSFLLMEENTGKQGPNYICTNIWRVEAMIIVCRRGRMGKRVFHPHFHDHDIKFKAGSIKATLYLNQFSYAAKLIH